MVLPQFSFWFCRVAVRVSLVLRWVDPAAEARGEVSVATGGPAAAPLSAAANVSAGCLMRFVFRSMLLVRVPKVLPPFIAVFYGTTIGAAVVGQTIGYRQRPKAPATCNFWAGMQ